MLKINTKRILCGLILGISCGSVVHGIDMRLGATNDTFRAIKYAPALLAWYSGFSGAIELTQGDDFSIQNATFYLASDFMNYALSVSGDGGVEHGPSMSFLLGDAVGIGINAAFDSADVSDTDLRFQLVARPIRHLSLSAQYELIDIEDSRISASVGIRPLTGNWNHRLTLGVGSAYTVGDTVELPTITLSTELIDGVLIEGGYSFQENNGFVSLGVAHDSLTTGTDIQANVRATAEEGSGFGGISYWVGNNTRVRQSYANTPIRHTVRFTNLRITEETVISPESPLARFRYNQELLNVLNSIEEVCADPRATAVLFDNVDIDANFAQINELYHALATCKEHGKQIVFYGADYSYAEYLLAAATADEIILQPSGTVDMRGLSAYRFYLKELADMFGITVHTYKAYEYKNAADIFDSSAMSPEEQEALEGILVATQAHLDTILRNRSEKFTNSVDEVVRNGPYLVASTAEELGIVDTTLFPHQLNEYLAENREYDKFLDYQEYESLQWSDVNNNKVALLNIAGFIQEGESTRGATVGVDSFLKAFDGAVKSNAIRAIVLRIDSGGGSVTASQSIAEAVYQARGKKPIIAWVGGTAASGAYYIAAATDYIIASPTSLTGSIGVLWSRVDISELLSEVGINPDGVANSENAEFFKIYTTPDENNKKAYNDAVDYAYNNFTRDVARYRNTDVGDIEAVARGRIWSGSDAKEIGLIDDLGHYAELIVHLQGELDSSKDIKFIVYDHSERSIGRELSSIVLNRFGLTDLAERFTTQNISIIDILRNPDHSLLYYDPYTEYTIE